METKEQFLARMKAKQQLYKPDEQQQAPQTTEQEVTDNISDKVIRNTKSDNLLAQVPAGITENFLAGIPTLVGLAAGASSVVTNTPIYMAQNVIKNDPYTSTWEKVKDAYSRAAHNPVTNVAMDIAKAGSNKTDKLFGKPQSGMESATRTVASFAAGFGPTTTTKILTGAQKGLSKGINVVGALGAMSGVSPKVLNVASKLDDAVMSADNARAARKALALVTGNWETKTGLATQLALGGAFSQVINKAEGFDNVFDTVGKMFKIDTVLSEEERDKQRRANIAKAAIIGAGFLGMGAAGYKLYKNATMSPEFLTTSLFTAGDDIGRTIVDGAEQSPSTIVGTLISRDSTLNNAAKLTSPPGDDYAVKMMHEAINDTTAAHANIVANNALHGRLPLKLGGSLRHSVIKLMDEYKSVPEQQQAYIATYIDAQRELLGRINTTIAQLRDAADGITGKNIHDKITEAVITNDLGQKVFYGKNTGTVYDKDTLDKVLRYGTRADMTKVIQDIDVPMVTHGLSNQSTSMLISSINDAATVPGVTDFIRRVREVYEDMEGLKLRSGLLNTEQAKILRDKTTFAGDKQSAFAYSQNEVYIRNKHWDTIKRILGWSGDKPMDDYTVRLQQQVNTAMFGGVDTPINPVLALSKYVQNTTIAATKNMHRNRILSTLTMNGDYQFVKPALIVDTYDNSTIKKITDSGLNTNELKMVEAGTLPAHKGTIVSSLVNGHIVKYVVHPDIAHIIEDAPLALDGILGVMRNMKNIMQVGTTGNIFFAPISALYGTQTVRQLGKALDITPANRIETIRGIKAAISYNTAKVLGNHFERLANRHMSFFGMTPEHVAAIADRMKSKTSTHFFDALDREAIVPTPTILDDIQNTGIRMATDQALKALSHNPTMLKLVTDYIHAVNVSIRTGNGLATTMKNLAPDDMTKLINGDVSVLKKVQHIAQRTTVASGDLLARPASLSVEKWQAVSPYLKPTMNAMYSHARAFKNNPTKYMAAIASGVVLPVIGEQTMIAALPDEYKEHYFNTLTENDRNSFMIIYVPGLPPENVIKIPIAQELRPIRAITHNLILGMTGVDTMYEGSKEGVVPRNVSTGVLEALSTMAGYSPPPIVGVGLNALGYRTIGMSIMPIKDNTKFGMEADEKLIDRGFNSSFTKAASTTLFGTLGSMLTSMADDFTSMSGNFGFTEGTIAAAGEVGKTVKGFYPMLNPIWGDAYKKSVTGRATNEVYAIRQSLDRAARAFKNASYQGKTTQTEINRPQLGEAQSFDNDLDTFIGLGILTAVHASGVQKLRSNTNSLVAQRDMFLNNKGSVTLADGTKRMLTGAEHKRILDLLNKKIDTNMVKELEIYQYLEDTIGIDMKHPDSFVKAKLNDVSTAQ